ncbi:MAG: hypothetical protein GXP42_05750 [Chloroflexi bacterium]|nr:hypothetical protein [Chloroflexota bacterium]
MRTQLFLSISITTVTLLFLTVVLPMDGHPVEGAVITVNTAEMTVADDGLCSLIEAIIAAETDAASGNRAGECPTLGPLQNNGGPTPTHVLPAGPGIDAIPPHDEGCRPGQSLDQRGFMRAGGEGKGGAACDMGAYEANTASAQSQLYLPLLTRRREENAIFIWWSEAENGRLTQPIGVRAGSNASGCRYVYPTDDWSNGNVEFDFYIPSSGNYYVWARAMGFGAGRNSFWVSVDGGEEYWFSIQPKNDNEWTWWWQPSPPPGQGENHDGPVYLTQGWHTIRYRARERDSRLDAVLITDDPSYTPTQFMPCPDRLGLVNDGSFENGPPPASSWIEETNTTCEWIGNYEQAWDGLAAYHGSMDFWGGGYCVVNDVWNPASTSVRQMAIVPFSDPTLYFRFLTYRPDAQDSLPDWAYVDINGNRVWTLYLVQANDTYPNWRLATVDLSDYAGQQVELKIGVESNGDLTGNIRIDFVELGASDLQLDMVPGHPFDGYVSGEQSQLSTTRPEP